MRGNILRKRMKDDLNLRAFRLAERSREVAEGGPMLNSGGCRRTPTSRLINVCWARIAPTDGYNSLGLHCGVNQD